MAEWEPTTVAIIWMNRLPRIITAYGVGIILGVSGVVMQAVIRNPLAEPYILGISSAASSGAAVVIVLLSGAGAAMVAGSAFLAALLSMLAVLWLGAGREGSPLRLVLAGVAVGFTFQALTNLLIISAKVSETGQAVLFWSLGSLTRTDLTQSMVVLGLAVVVATGFWVFGPYLDALASGDRTCLTIGLAPRRLRLFFLVPLSAAVGLAVAAAGGIGFIGLVIPHLVRPFVRHRHRPLIAGTALASAVFLLATDTVARTLLAPTEIPIGVITAVIGAPFLMLLVRRSRTLK